jgi:hypothetical protein
VGLLNVFYLRRGHYEIDYLEVDDDTSGWGLNLQLSNWFGARYDQADVPRPWGLPKVERQTWSVWADPVAIFAN